MTEATKLSYTVFFSRCFSTWLIKNAEFDDFKLRVFCKYLSNQISSKSERVIDSFSI